MIADHFHFEDYKKIFALFLQRIGVRYFFFASSNLFELKLRTSTLCAYGCTVVRQSALHKALKTALLILFL